MDEILQRLGFDAGPAIQALQQLDAAMAQFESRLGASAQAFGSFNKSAGRTVAALIQISKHGKSAASALSAVVSATSSSANQNVAANAQAAASAATQMAASMAAAGNTSQTASVKIGNALARVGVQSNQTANQVTRNVQRMTISLNLLSRIVFTQAIVRALSTLRFAFRQTLGDAIVFQRQIALIQTIDDAGTSFQKLGSNVRAISEEFNIPLLETAAGLYQTISNQIGNAAQSQIFLAESAQFAKATGSDLKNSVDLLSGALKSFNLDASETSRVAGVFFKTIDLGRVQANELANSFGRVGPVAAELGLSLEETSAALASITIRGSKTSEALTQVRAITTALLKPSVAMQRVLRDLGFSSGEAAIKTLGFAGTLQALAQSTEGSAAQMAALFPNVRGLAGAASLTSDNLASLSRGIREMEAAGSDFSKQKFLQATATDAEQVTKEITKLKNAFTVDLGQAALSALASLSKLGGGADNLVKLVRVSDTALLGLVGTLAILRAETSANIRGFTALGRALGLISLAPLAAGLGSSIGGLIDEALRESRNAQIKSLEQANAQELKLFEAKLKQQRDASNKADQERLQDTRRVFQELNKIYLRDVDNAKQASDSIAANTKASLDSILSTREKLVDELGRASDAARDIAEASRGRVGAAKERQGDREFETSTSKLSGIQKALALAERAQAIADDASKKLGQAGLLGDEDKIAEAIRLFDKAQSTAEKAQAAAGSNRFLQNQALDDLRHITEQQIRAEQELQQVQTSRQKALDAERQKQQAITDQIREQTKIAAENTGLFDGKGQQFSADEQARRDAARLEALKKIAAAGLSQEDLSATAALGLADFVSRFEGELARDPIRLQFTVENAVAQIKSDLESAFQNFKLGAGVNVGGLEQVLGRDLNTPDQIAEGLEEATKKAAELRLQIDQATTLGPKGDALKEEIAAIFAQLDAGSAKNRELLGSEEQTAAFDGILAQFQQLQESGRITNEQFNQLIAKRNEFGQAMAAEDGGLFNINEMRLGFSGSIELLDQALVKLQQLKQVQAQATPVDPGLTAQLSRLEAVLAQQPGAQFSQSAQAIGSATAPSAAIAASWQAAAAAAERTARAAAAAAAAGSSNQAFGGMMHLASGGATRGIDTIPAMLSPGEFVMNARSSRKFYAQLQAMNAGQTPTFRENGGSVTNVGDIHIAVNGSQGNTQTIREIGRGLRREIRRGTLDL